MVTINKRRLSAFTAVGAALGVLAATPAAAQTNCSRQDIRQNDATRAIFFTDANCVSTAFRMEVGEKKARLGDDSDELSSIHVGKGMKVVIYSDADFKGAEAVLYPGQYPHLQQYGDEISSIKVEAFDGGDKLVALFEHDGDMAAHPEQTVHYLALGEYNKTKTLEDQLLLKDQASGIYIPAGWEVSLYDNYRFEGTKLDLSGGTDGKFVQLPTEGFNDVLSSIDVRKAAYKLTKIAVKDLKPEPDAQQEMVRTGQNTTCEVKSGASSLKCSGQLTYSVEDAVEATKSTEVSATESIEVTATESAGVEGVASASLATSVGLAVTEAFGQSTSEAKTTTNEDTVAYEVEAQPGHPLTISVEAMRQPMTADVVYTFVNANNPSDTYETTGKLKYDSYSEARIVLEDKNGKEVSPAAVADAAAAAARGDTAYDGYMKIEADMATLEAPVPTYVDDGQHEYHLMGATGHSFAAGQKHYSKNKAYFLVFEDADLQVVEASTDEILWSLSETLPGKGPIQKVVYQDDGNLAAYGPGDAFLWSALHKGSPRGTELHLSDDGDLRIVQPPHAEHKRHYVAWSARRDG